MTDRITDALNGLLSPSDLDDDEQEAYFDRFAELMRTASPEEGAFWAERRRLGLGVGMDDDGNLIYSAVLMPPATKVAVNAVPG